ncbi:hypothetical protein K437DRAFT_257493 [Tilletiaria anomala UBC 951]|uniref:Uncharacterized protein n=1 Tax=Tilletiaria anomala (strain ATCC 24038 / CBS 436.72 / UBC 951) TaxID=1037660 RepID=A0A066VT39_TILAU|nr:uncharacterized protein K437DRAFT_257493 [Tilletiaria anomala UBC 951]KDN43433.1 hypothetical protein K437DRAFT_257493 [Tilletiaria anomala UBC 951]
MSETKGTSGEAAPNNSAFANDGSFMEQFKRIQAEKLKAAGAFPPVASANASPTLQPAASSTPSQGSPLLASSPLTSGKKADGKMDAVERRKAMEERIRNRGKRKAENTGDEMEAQVKQARDAKEERYLQEVRRAEMKSLKDAGSGVRSLVK